MNLLDHAVTAALCSTGRDGCWRLLRLFRGPRAQDRVVALDFMAVLAMLVLLVLAIRYDSSMYFEARC
jgi:multicomponent K+:H+ antiporter subunit F